MKGLFLSLLVTAVVVVGGAVFINKKGIPLPGRLGAKSVTLPQVSIVGQSPASSSGQVMGVETVNVTHFADRFAGIGQVVSKIAGSLGVQTVKTGQELVNNVTSTPTSAKDVIDMAAVVREVSSRVESIPGSLVKDAKIEYCRQVLQAATASATQK